MRGGRRAAAAPPEPRLLADWMIAAIGILVMFIIFITILSFVLPPAPHSRGYNPATTPHPTTSSSTSSTAGSTTTSSTSSGPTTAPPTPGLLITCPAPATVVLGEPYTIYVTGNAVATPINNVGSECLRPFVQCFDAIGTGPMKACVLDDTRDNNGARPVRSAVESTARSAVTLDHIPSMLIYGSQNVFKDVQKTTPSLRQSITTNIAYPMVQRRRIRTAPAKRSATFSSPNLEVFPNPLLQTYTSIVPSDMNSDVSPTQVVSVVNTATGGKLIVSDKITLSTTLLTGKISTVLNGLGNCSGTTLGEPIVLWDRKAEGYSGGRWLIAEVGAFNTSLCLYLSQTSDATGAWNAFEFVFTSPFSFPKIGIWPRLYALATLNQTCVIDKMAVWADDPAPALMCGAVTDRVWTPVNTESDIVPVLTEGFVDTQPGVIFMSLSDDELDDTAPPSPTQDYLNVQHWYQVNFTALPYPYRTTTYQLPVTDFDLRPLFPIPSPAGVQLTPLTGFISNRLVYRYMDGVVVAGDAVPQSIVGCFTTFPHAVVGPTYIRWFELRLYKIDENAQAQFHVYQDGAVDSAADGLYQWIPTSTIDSRGTIAVGFSVSNQTFFPRLAATSQLYNDPLNMIRQKTIVAQPPTSAPLVPSGPWGSYGSMSVLDPNRFYMSGQVAASVGWQATTLLMNAKSELYNRTFIASYYECQTITAACSQPITAVG